MARRLKEFAPDDLTPPEGWEERTDDAVVLQIAESLKREGLREPIVVTAAGHIIHGVHRWAAAIKVDAKLVECIVEPLSKTPEEHEAKVLAENVHRRHFSQGALRDMIADLVRLREKRIIAEDAISAGKQSTEPEGTPEKGNDSHAVTSEHRPPSNPNPPTARTQAVAEVAKKLGKSEAAVRHQVARSEDAKAKAAQESEPAALDTRVALVDERGTEIPAHLLERWALHREESATIASLCRQVSMRLRKLKGSKGFSGAFIRLKGDLNALEASARNYEPSIVCAWCGGEKDANCKTCNGFGFQSEAHTKSHPKE